MHDPKLQHAMMSFALLGGVLVSPRPRPERPASQVSPTSNRK
jgi:hypothetical protein